MLLKSCLRRSNFIYVVVKFAFYVPPSLARFLVMRLPRLWIRQLVKLFTGIAMLCGAVLFVDFYLNFLPSSVHSRLPLHTHSPIVTDIKLVSCLKLGSCLPDGQDGWYKHPKELSLGKAWFSKTYLYTRRFWDEDLYTSTQVVLDVAISSINGAVPLEVVEDIKAGDHVSSNTDGSTSSKAAEKAIREKASKLGWVEQDPDAGLWVKYGKYHRSKSVSAVKVLFGDDAVYPLPGWRMVDGGLKVNSAKWAPRLALRIGPKQEPARPQLQIYNQKFKICQLTDLHMRAGSHPCEDPEPRLRDGETCDADRKTLEFINDALDSEKPDFIVYTGDMIYGEGSGDPETALLKALAPAIERQIPFAAIFGNHDGEAPGNNAELMQIMEELPFSLAQAGSENATGVGNYMLTASVNKHPALAMYFMDTHTRKDKFGYDYIHKSQLDYMRDLHQSIAPQQAGYAHIPLGMAFIHIPLPEYRNVNNPMVGTYKEAVIAPASDEGTRALLPEIGVSVVTAGHDHCNDYCILDSSIEGSPGVWLCYGGGTGYGGYGNYPDKEGVKYQRRIRFFDVDTQGSSISSYKIVHNRHQVIDRQILVKNGVAYNELDVSINPEDSKQHDHPPEPVSEAPLEPVELAEPEATFTELEVAKPEETIESEETNNLE